MKLQVKDCTFEQFEAIEREVRGSHVSVQDTIETWDSLHVFFRDATPETDYKYFFTYFRLYVELSWSLFGLLERDTITDELFSRQVPAAIYGGTNVWLALIRYLQNRTINTQDMIQVFTKIRNSFLASNAVVGKLKGTTYRVKDLVPDIKKLADPKLSSLESAAILSKVKDIIVSNGKENLEKYYSPDLDQANEWLIGMFDIFLHLVPENVPFTVDMILNPELYEGGAVERVVEEKGPEKNPTISNYRHDFEENARLANKEVQEKAVAAGNIQEKKNVPTKSEENKLPAAAPIPKPTQLPQVVKNTPPKIEPAKAVPQVKAPETKKENLPQPTPVVRVETQVKLAASVVAPKIEPAKSTEPPKTEPSKKPETKIENKPEPVKAPAPPKEDPMFFKKNNTPTPKAEAVPAPQALQNPPEPKKVEEPKKPEAPVKKLSYSEIKKQIENRYPKDPSGEFVNVMDVLNELQRLAVESGDEKVKDLYYFNEQSGQFEWHDTTPTA